MRRRGLLGVFGWLASLTCCGTQVRPEASATSSADPVGSNSGVDLPFSESVLTRSSRRDEIPAITDPVFGEDWRGIELEVKSELGERYLTRPRLVDADLVIGLMVEGDARAYPVNVLQFHEFVHDSLRGPYSQPTAHSVGARWSPVGRYGDSQPGSASTAASGGGTSCSTATRPEICWS